MHFGVWDSWGFDVSYCNYDKVIMVGFIHWYISIEFRRNNNGY